MEMLWLAEHHFDGICAYVDPVTFAAALAASTEHIQIGFAVAQMSLHHPIRMAEQMALIDNISRGRLVVGPRPRHCVQHLRLSGLRHRPGRRPTSGCSRPRTS